MAKRIYRNDMSQDQRDKIAAANVGKHLTQTTKAAISRSLRKYWAGLPMKPTGETDNAAGSGATTSTQTTPPPLPLNPYEE